MGQKKKRAHPDVEEMLSRPWCYYCERDFDDLKILISHQKAKHFKCDRCGRRLNTAGGLSVHMNQVHKEQLLQVENALPNRQGLEVEIFGMEGIPEEFNQAHSQRIIAQFYQAEAERRGGNQGGGVNQGGQVKKPKFESPADLKKRLAEHKARKAEALANGDANGGNTPLMDAGADSPMQSPANFADPAYTPVQAPYGATPVPSAYGSFSQDPYPSPATNYPRSFASQASFSGPPGGQYNAQIPPPPQFAVQRNMHSGFQGATPNFQTPQYGGMGQHPPPFGVYQGSPSNTPPNGLPRAPPSLPMAPGLPQRPSFGASPSAMSSGPPGGHFGPGWNGQDQSAAMSSAYSPQPPVFNAGYPGAASVDMSGNEAGDDIDKLIRMAEAGIKPPKKDHVSNESISTPPTNTTATTVAAPAAGATNKTAEPMVEKKFSKKDKPMRMVYSDNELSPEEKMAKMARYAFILEVATEAAVSV